MHSFISVTVNNNSSFELSQELMIAIIVSSAVLVVTCSITICSVCIVKGKKDKGRKKNAMIKCGIPLCHSMCRILWQYMTYFLSITAVEFQWSIIWYQYFIYRVRIIACCMFVKWDHGTLDPTAKWHVVISLQSLLFLIVISWILMVSVDRRRR